MVGRDLTSIEASVLETLAYSDVFDFPLTAEEVWRWLPKPATLAEVRTALASDRLSSVVISIPPYFVLGSRDHLVPLREQRRQSSKALRRRAKGYGRLISRLPFVRLVAITGSLAVENAGEGDDLDFMIITAPGRVWLTRALTMLVVRLAHLRGTNVCPNYFLSQSGLALADRSYYTARELLQMAPLTGPAVYQRLLAQNAWWLEYLPNTDRPLAGSDPEPRGSLLRRFVEGLLSGRLGDLIERWFLRRKGAELRRHSGGNLEAVFDETMCKGHLDGHGLRTQSALQERLRKLMASVS